MTHLSTRLSCVGVSRRRKREGLSHSLDGDPGGGSGAIRRESWSTKTEEEEQHQEEVQIEGRRKKKRKKEKRKRVSKFILTKLNCTIEFLLLITRWAYTAAECPP